MGVLRKKEMDMSCNLKGTEVEQHGCLAYNVSSGKEMGLFNRSIQNSSTMSLSLEQHSQASGTLQGSETATNGNQYASQAFSCSNKMNFTSLDNLNALEASLDEVCISKPYVDSLVKVPDNKKLDCQNYKNDRNNTSRSSTSTSDGPLEQKESGSRGVSSQGKMKEPDFQESKREDKFSLSTLLVNEPVSFADITNKSRILHYLNPYPQKAPVAFSRKKLLILDINGILADIVYPPPRGYKANTKIAGRAIFKRPYCSDFLNFCLEQFDVGIWSSRSKKIVDRVISYLMGDLKHRLLFCWDISHCTESKFRTLENRHKVLVFKELRKIWDKCEPNLPWEIGDYDESNTLLLDDSPYKALLNPPHTAIFPYSYDFKDRADDSIGPGGNVRVYLEELAVAENIQKYVKQHPFGQSAITERSMSWNFYNEVIKGQLAATVGD